MKKHVIAYERSPLARNVYNMILSQIVETEVEMRDNTDPAVTERVPVDLVLFGNVQKDKKSEISKKIKKISAPVILLVKHGMIDDWRDLETDRVRMLERPFFPDDLTKIIRKMWGL